MAVVAVDAGTTMIKAVAFGEDGSERAVARENTRVLHPREGLAEQDMAEVWAAVATCVRAATAELDESVDAVAVTAQGDGCWLVDEERRPTGPAVLWNDARAASIVEGWRASGVLDEAFKRTGCTAFAGLPHAILRWLGEHDPDRLARSAAALTCGGWLFAALTGELAVDESEAAAPWLDVQRRDYDFELLDLYGLSPWARRLLPELRHDDQRVAPLRATAATTLGIPRGTPVVLAPYDIASTAIGVGAVHTGQACGILGTTLCTEIVAEQPDLAADPVGLTIPLGVPGRYLRAFPTLAGREVLDWAAGVLGLAGADELCRVAASAPAGARGLAFLPYLSPAGERAPFLDPDARGSLEGLSTEHDRSCIARAVVEGLTYVIRDCLRSAPVPPREIRLSGGGANSTEWCELIADVTGVPTTRTAGTEAGAKGAFLTALVATGRDSDHEAAAARCVHTADTFEPDTGRTDRYTELFSSFLAARTDASHGWPRLRQVRAGLEERGA